MGKGIVEKLKKEYPLEVQWIGYELHPETPKEGLLHKEAFPDSDVEKLMANFNVAGEPYGVTFKNLRLISNTRLALESSEFAREHGKFKEFHNVVFKSYFESGKNIGKLDTILDCAQAAGLNVKLLKQALEQQKYSRIIDRSRKLGAQHNVAGLPTFIFSDGQKIVGAQRYETFLRAIKKYKE